MYRLPCRSVVEREHIRFFELLCTCRTILSQPVIHIWSIKEINRMINARVLKGKTRSCDVEWHMTHALSSNLIPHAHLNAQGKVLWFNMYVWISPIKHFPPSSIGFDQSVYSRRGVDFVVLHRAEIDTDRFHFVWKTIHQYYNMSGKCYMSLTRHISTCKLIW